MWRTVNPCAEYKTDSSATRCAHSIAAAEMCSNMAGYMMEEILTVPMESFRGFGERIEVAVNEEQ